MAQTLNLFRELVKFSLKGKSDLVTVAKGVTGQYKNAQRFLMPINGLILNNQGDALDAELRLPFPSIFLEFESEVVNEENYNISDSLNKMSFVGDVYDRHIVFAREIEDEKIEVQLSSRLVKREQGRDIWYTVPFKMVFPRLLDNGGVDVKVFPTHQSAFRAADVMNKDRSEEERMDVQDIGMLLLKPSFKAVCELLEALACSNVAAELKPNKKRLAGRRPGELPYDDYHELVVYVSSGSSDSSEGDGTGAKRREHLRRGHVRRYKSGLKIWVPSHVVNAGSAGKLEKHYKIKPS